MPHNLHLDQQDPIVVGSDFRVKATLKDEAGDPVTGAAGNLTLKIAKPNGTLATPTVLLEDGLGVYSFVYTTGDGGRHRVNIKYAGSFNRVVEAYFIVHPPAVA